MHPSATLVIPEMGPSVRCPRCGRFLSRLTPRHLHSRLCSLNTQRHQSQDLLRLHVMLLLSTRFMVNDVEIEIATLQVSWTFLVLR
jgi:uncharacterized protein (DUF983 family)